MMIRRGVSIVAFVVVLLAARSAAAFCGFYVGGADTKLFNDATQVVLLRQGQRTVLSMQNTYKGPPEGFAMVVPVPVVLRKENVRTLSKGVFDRLDQLTSPRLVEYWEQDPCGGGMGIGMGLALAPAAAKGAGMAGLADRSAELKVKVEAQFSVGEYDIVVLSAEDSAGLETWLHEQQYAIPKGSEEYLRPYVQGGSKFFVAKVDVKKVKFSPSGDHEARDKDGRADLSPLRFFYDTPQFSLPIRLGLMNSSGTQDLIVHILAKNQRYEPANYPSVTIPTNIDLAEGAKPYFGRFYATLFDETVKKNPKAIVTEYSWDAGSCDPCPGPIQGMSEEDFATLGGDLVWGDGPLQPKATLSAPKLKQLAGDGHIQAAQSRLTSCLAQRLGEKPKLAGRIELGGKVSDVENGGTVDLAVTKNDTKDDALAECTKRSIGQMRLLPKAPAGPVTYTVTYAVVPSPASPYEYTVTRLHARYTKDSVGDDITFKAVHAIVGGRENYNQWGGLEHGATRDETNNFQARYAIRHGWRGKLTCDKPTWHQWGGPPDGREPTYEPARKTAFVPRGGIDLAQFARSEIKELGVKAGKGPLGDVPDAGGEELAGDASAETTPSAAPSVTTAPSASAPPAPSGSPAPPAKSSCGCSTTPSRETFAPLAGLAILALAIRRRRRR